MGGNRSVLTEKNMLPNIVFYQNFANLFKKERINK